MNAKEFLESLGFTSDEPYSYYNATWLGFMEQYARYRIDLQQPNIEGDSMNMEILDYNPDEPDFDDINKNIL